jgi:hypothetical protein
VYENGVIGLSWDAAIDDSGQVTYKLERSEDENNWYGIVDSTSELEFIDNSISFNAQYFYQLTVMDGSGNKSYPIVTDITTGDFSPNVLAGKDTNITSKDELASANIKKGTFKDDVVCSLNKDESIKNDQEGMILLSGFYELSCKDESGELQTSYDKPIQFTFNAKNLKSYKNYKLFVLSDDNLTDTNAVYNKNNKMLQFSSTKAAPFAVYGSKGSNNLLIWIIVGGSIVIFIAVIIIISRIRRGLAARATQAEFDKSHDLRSTPAVENDVEVSPDKDYANSAVEQPQYPEHKSLKEMVEEAERAKRSSRK